MRRIGILSIVLSFVFVSTALAIPTTHREIFVDSTSVSFEVTEVPPLPWIKVHRHGNTELQKIRPGGFASLSFSISRKVKFNIQFKLELVNFTAPHGMTYWGVIGCLDKGWTLEFDKVYTITDSMTLYDSKGNLINAVRCDIYIEAAADAEAGPGFLKINVYQVIEDEALIVSEIGFGTNGE